MSAQQGQFEFDAPASNAGYTKWLVGRKIAARELARRLNLPLGHEVETWLTSGIRLRGKLQLVTEVLMIEEEKVRHLPLRIGHVPFTYREVESCVRLD